MAHRDDEHFRLADLVHAGSGPDANCVHHVRGVKCVHGGLPAFVSPVARRVEDGLPRALDTVTQIFWPFTDRTVADPDSVAQCVELVPGAFGSLPVIVVRLPPRP